MTTSHQEQATRRSDAGMSLIEVLVALLVFGILSTGIVAGTITISRMTDDTRARMVAANLAAQDIALVRAIGDPFSLSDTTTVTTTPTVGSRTYTVVRTTKLVSQTGTDVTCSSSTDLFYARVNVRVTWAGQLATTSPVQDDTIVASQGRINDSATGSVSVAVTNASGGPQPGVGVTITPTQNGSALASQPAATDANGCTRVTGVTAGTYSVVLSKNGYLDVQQNPAPAKTVIVTAGTNQSISVQYDQAATFGTTYVSWPVPYISATTTPMRPTNLDTTFLNSTSGPYTTTTPAASVALHPFVSGYTAVAGTPATPAGITVCAANDPSAWPATTSGVNRGTGVRASAAAPAGGSTPFMINAVKPGIPMGVVLVRQTSGTIPAGTLLTATTAAPTSGGTGNPGCTTTTTYTFAATTGSSTTQAALLLPYGSYTISYQSGSASGVVPAANLSVPTNVNGGGVDSSGIVTLDPRPAS